MAGESKPKTVYFSPSVQRKLDLYRKQFEERERIAISERQAVTACLESGLDMALVMFERTKGRASA